MKQDGYKIIEQTLLEVSSSVLKKAAAKSMKKWRSAQSAFNKGDRSPNLMKNLKKLDRQSTRFDDAFHLKKSVPQSNYLKDRKIKWNQTKTEI